ncbi:MAG: hypothetical protein OJI67_12000 [Prosthecobacter sp.]|nr:hypothetical protein [Prosthecobacter sp.]
MKRNIMGKGERMNGAGAQLLAGNAYAIGETGWLSKPGSMDSLARQFQLHFIPALIVLSVMWVWSQVSIVQIPCIRDRSRPKKGSVVTNFVPLTQDQATTCRPGSKPYDLEAMAHEVTMDLRVLFKKESCEARWVLDITQCSSYQRIESVINSKNYDNKKYNYLIKHSKNMSKKFIFNGESKF